MSRGCGSKCVYMDCGKSARNNADLKFRKFPTNDDVRQMWILNSGNVTLMSLTPKELSSRYVCDNHFISTDYTNENKLRLHKHAVPVQYKDIENFHVTTPTNIYKKVCVKSPIQLEKISNSGSPNMYIQTPNKGSCFFRNPTARTFRTTFRINAKMSLMKPSSCSNCEPDDDNHLLSQAANNDTKIDEDSSESSMSSNASFDSWTLDSIQLEQEAVVTLENCSNTYFAGYLAMKLTSKFSCLNCQQLLIRSDHSIPNKLDFLIFCKNYDSKISEMHLKIPTTELTQFIILAQKILADILEKKPHRKKIAQFAEKKIKTELICLLNVIETCIPHIEFLIKHLIICKLFRNFNWVSKNVKHVKTEKSQKKLKILRNV